MKQIKLKNKKKKWKRKDLKYETNNHVHDFQQFETIRSFGDNIYIGKIRINEAEMDQSNLLKNIVEFSNKTRPKKEKIME